MGRDAGHFYSAVLQVNEEQHVVRQLAKIDLPALLVYDSVFCVVPRVTYGKYAPLGTP
jgi:hypothetical protein